VAFVGDSHLLAGEPVVDRFLEFLAEAPRRFERLVLVGDIFDLWLARPHLHEEHHRRVLEGLGQARSEGLAIDYAVGNRDFGVETLPESPFDRVATTSLDAPARGGWVAEHGDLVNQADRQYRTWRAFSRSRVVLGTALRLPAAVGVPLSQWIERKMRTTNLAYRRAFPTSQASERAEQLFAATDARFLVLGHFHQELRFDVVGGEVLVLPDWKRSLRHAEWTGEGAAAGTMRFTDSL
jgi:UDP-2,3-diacylglucosamine pyrophosphatase LpxH